MFVTIINDCCDANEAGRQSTRASLLFPGSNVTFMGLSNYSELEAAGHLVDVLDAAAGQEGVVLVNSAPRHGTGKKWENGTPFGWFWYGKTLVAATVAGQTLSMVKKLGIMKEFQVTDIPTVLDVMIKNGKFEAENRDRVVKSQFRSYEYLPFLAAWVKAGEQIPSEKLDMNDVPDVPQAVWFVDSFGNCKTTLLPDEVGFVAGEKMKTKVGEFTCFNRLKDVPSGEAGMTIGSSGFGNTRLIEVTINGRRASDEFGLKSGTELR
jgi:hypothetical protein